MKKTLFFALLFSFSLNGFSQFQRNNSARKHFVKNVNAINQAYFQRSLNTNYQSLTNMDVFLAGSPQTIIEQSIYTYDSFGRDLVAEEIEYNINNGLVNGKDKTEYYYDTQQGWFDHMLVYEYDTTTSQYNLTEKKEILLYDTTLRLPLEVVYATNNAGTWVNQGKDIYTYDTSGNVLIEIDQSWNAGWQNSSKEENTYNPGGQIMETVISYWNQGVWEISGKETYTYDAQHRLFDKVFYQMISGTYTNVSRNQFYYNSGGQLIEKVLQEWNSNQWMDVNKKAWTYDVDGNVLTEIDYNKSSGVWVEDEMLDFTDYTNTFTRADLLLPEVIDAGDEDVDYFHHQINDVVSSAWDGANWQPEISIHLTYQPISVAEIDHIAFADVRIYPNPTVDNLYIDTDKILSITIFDLSGKQILTDNLVQGKNTINISSLQSGIYLATIYSNNHSATLKIVKR